MRRLRARGAPFRLLRWCSTPLTPPSPPAGGLIKVRRQLPRLFSLIGREQVEEKLKDELPPTPRTPMHWSYHHTPGTSFFSLSRTVTVGRSSEESLTVQAQLELKDYLTSYRMDTGERLEPLHIIFRLFVDKKDAAAGGLEFMLACVESEMVLDGLVVHSSREDFEVAKSRSTLDHQVKLKSKFRGPMMNELDETLIDELLDYLDDRGVNNVFAEYILAQSFVVEQEEYMNWLQILRDAAA